MKNFLFIFLSVVGFLMISSCAEKQKPCICKYNSNGNKDKHLSQQEIMEEVLVELKKINRKLNGYDITITSN